jgi:glycosyltransferase involved in cell wall biosynthesis
MKRVLMMGPTFDQRGGIASVVSQYRNAGLFRDYPVEFIATHCDGSAAAKTRIAIAGLAALMRRLVSGSVSGVHVLIASGGSFWRKTAACLLARVFGVPYIVHVHGALFDHSYAAASAPMRRLFESLLTRSARVIALSPTWRDKLLAIAPRAAIATLANPIQLAAFTPPLQRRTDTVLFLGEVSDRKGISDLIAAVARLRTSRPELRLLVGGLGDEAKLDRLIRVHRMQDAVERLGWVSGTAKETLLAQAMVLALPSYQEGQPMVILEALSAGLPVVASRVGGIPDTITDGSDGLLIDAGDVGQLAAALERVLSNPSLADRLARRARHRVEREFSVEAVLPALLHHYQELGLFQTPRAGSDIQAPQS